MSLIKNNLEAILALVAEKKDVEAIEKYYADDVVVYDVDGSVTEGKTAVIEAIKFFMGGITETKKDVIEGIVVNDEVKKSWNISTFEGTHAEMGEMNMRQIAINDWNDEGLVTKVQFIPDTSL